MTITEQAIALIRKFNPYVYCFMGSGMLTNTEDENVILSESQKCAVVAIDHSVETIKAMHLKHYSNTIDFKVTECHSETLKHLQELRDEIHRITLEQMKTK